MFGFLITALAEQKLGEKSNVPYYYNQTSMLTKKMLGNSLLCLSYLKPLYLSRQDDQEILSMSS